VGVWQTSQVRVCVCVCVCVLCCCLVLQDLVERKLCAGGGGA